MDASCVAWRAAQVRTAKACGTSAADLKFLRRSPRAPHGNFKSKAALELYVCSCPLLSEVRERLAAAMARELRKAGRSTPLAAGVKSAEATPRATVTTKPVSPGRARRSLLTPSRRECRCFGLTCSDYAHVLFHSAHEAMGAAKHLAFPVPSAFSRETYFVKLGRIVPRERENVSVTREAPEVLSLPLNPDVIGNNY